MEASSQSYVLLLQSKWSLASVQQEQLVVRCVGGAVKDNPIKGGGINFPWMSVRSGTYSYRSGTYVGVAVGIPGYQSISGHLLNTFTPRSFWEGKVLDVSKLSECTQPADTSLAQTGAHEASLLQHHIHVSKSTERESGYAEARQPSCLK
ncbi:hypothetical protein Q7C36_002013 [Tachysurus vachellii]|uniref:Uncharacterized protein n=1 Tax=Tachysurus vachellii TaxID=175792 RepID=A0AA88NS29_TACVA|nr:hypothetical protein Q7C36_002013 [Tachysurus vachellii]